MAETAEALLGLDLRAATAAEGTAGWAYPASWKFAAGTSEIEPALYL